MSGTVAPITPATIREMLDKYLSAKESSIDDLLATFLASIVAFLRDQYKVPTDDLQMILASLALTFPMQVIRKRKHDDLSTYGYGAGSALVGAFDSNRLHWLCAELDELLATYNASNERGLQWKIPLPLNFIGFDPRSADPKLIKATWEKALKDACSSVPYLAAAMPPSVVTLGDSYNATKARIYADFHNPATRYDLLLVDFAWLPELAYLGQIVPFNQYQPNLKDKMSEVLSKKMPSPRGDWWADVLSHLSSAGNHLTYALPMFINYHGSLTAKEDAKIVDRLAVSYRRCALQTAHSACCAYELYAEFAYYGAEPVVVSRETNGQFVLKKVDFSSDPVCEAMAAYLTRVFLASSSGNLWVEDLKNFRLDHIGEMKSLLAAGPNAFNQAVCFSKELCTHAGMLDGRYKLDEPIRNTPKHLLHNTYLSSFGGYGIAVSRQAYDVEVAMQVAYKVFEDALANLVDSGHALWFSDCDDRDEFMRVHCRPRIPFWSHIEELISVTMEELYGTVEPALSNDLAQTGPGSAKFDSVQKGIKKSLSENPAQSLILSLEKRIRLALGNSGWVL